MWYGLQSCACLMKIADSIVSVFEALETMDEEGIIVLDD